MEFFYIIEIAFLLNIAYRELKVSRWKEEFLKSYAHCKVEFRIASITEDSLKEEAILQPEGRYFFEGLEKGDKKSWENKFFIAYYYRNFICRAWSKKFTGHAILGIIIIIGVLYLIPAYSERIFEDYSTVKNTSFFFLLFFSILPLFFRFFDNRCYNYLFGKNQRLETVAKMIEEKNQSLMKKLLEERTKNIK